MSSDDSGTPLKYAVDESPPHLLSAGLGLQVVVLIVAGIVLTHAHEDHFGAVAHLWPRLGAPVFATPFTANLLRRKLGEAGLRLGPQRRPRR